MNIHRTFMVRTDKYKDDIYMVENQTKQSVSYGNKLLADYENYIQAIVTSHIREMPLKELPELSSFTDSI